MIYTAEDIKRYINITPAVWEKTKHINGLSYGLDEAGYSLRLSETDKSSKFTLNHGRVHLAVTMEHIEIPTNVIAFVYNKSTLAREGLIQPTTTLEPGWRGFITLELIYFGPHFMYHLEPGMPIAQVCFHELTAHTKSYEGKYQDQPETPVFARR